jgi:fructokinase
MATAARNGGAFVFFEPSSVPADRELFSAALRAAHVVKYSADRVREPFTDLLPSGFIEIQTLGLRGLRFRLHSLVPDWVELPALSAGAATDTSGAGDWCTAGFLHSVFRSSEGNTVRALDYNEIYRSLRLGQAMAALSVRHVGARGLMRASTTEDALEMAQDVLAGAAVSANFAAAHAQATVESVCCEALASYAKQLPMRSRPLAS